MTTVESEGDKAGCDYGHAQLLLIYISLCLTERENDAYRQAKKATIIYHVLLYGIFIEHFWLMPLTFK